MSDAVVVASITTVPVLLAQLGLFLQTFRTHHTIRKVDHAVGIANGETILELLEIAKLGAYQRGQNEKILSQLDSLADRLEQLDRHP